MKKYAVYKPELRLPGVTEVPEHWKVLRNSVIFREVNETGYGDLELLSILSDRGVIKQSETGRKERAPEDRSQYKRILKGDIGYNLMNAFIGAIGISSYDGIISPAYAVCRPKIEIDATYFHYLFRTDLYLTEFDRNAYGIMDERNRLYFDNFKKIYVPFPPIDEQRRIVTYINHKLAQIDQFICYKRRLIELLNEQKTALINRAVTKGLNSNVPMKDSGIEWLGEVPAHWEVKKLKHLAMGTGYGIQMGPFGSMLTDLKYENTGCKLYGQQNTIQNNFNIGSRYVTLEQFQAMRHYEVTPGDIVLTRKGSLGNCRVVPDGIQKGIIDSDTIRVRINKEIVKTEFLVINLHESWYLQEQISFNRRGAILGGLNTNTIAELQILLPPIHEQQLIIKYLSYKFSELEQIIRITEKEIELIQEYRTTLISDAVTGKIDVRDTLERGAALVAGGV